MKSNSKPNPKSTNCIAKSTSNLQIPIKNQIQNQQIHMRRQQASTENPQTQVKIERHPFKIKN